ncbi:MAG: PDZ domain-containing protein [Acidobacteriia bacterium]|nr:PDZ domain-containing protein [Terriglobia bacterium]
MFYKFCNQVFLAGILAAAVLAQVPAPPAPPASPASPALPQAAAPPVPPASTPMHLMVKSGSFLGVNVSEVDANRAKELNLKEVHGVEITSVEEDSPAEKAGLKRGDIVLDYQGQRVEGTEQFVRMVRETPAGRQAKLNVLRGGATQSISAVIGTRSGKSGRTEWAFRSTMPKFDLWIPDIPRAYTSWRSSMLGIEAESLEGQLASYFGVKDGVLVRSVIKGTAAEKAGVKAGDVIVRVENDVVSSPRELSTAIRSNRSKKTFTLTVMREKKETAVPVTMEEERPRIDVPRGRTVVRRDDFDDRL